MSVSRLRHGLSHTGINRLRGASPGLRFAIVHPIPGPEERNADHLLEAGAAIRCNNLPALARKIDWLLQDPAWLNRDAGEPEQARAAARGARDCSRAA